MSVPITARSAKAAPKKAQQALVNRYLEVRRQSESLSAHLSDGDMTVQSMTDASPPNGIWHTPAGFLSR